MHFPVQFTTLHESQIGTPEESVSFTCAASLAVVSCPICADIGFSNEP